jgi:hypothetical protein
LTRPDIVRSFGRPEPEPELPPPPPEPHATLRLALAPVVDEEMLEEYYRRIRETTARAVRDGYVDAINAVAPPPVEPDQAPREQRGDPGGAAAPSGG